MKHRIQFILLLFFLLFLIPKNVQAAPPPAEIVNEQIQKLGIDEVQQYWDDVVSPLAR